jgi:hypothetical protein
VRHRVGRRPVEPTIDALGIADSPVAWRELGFDVDADGVCTIGTVRVRLAGPGAGRGILGWSVRGLPAAELDGLLTNGSDASAREAAAPHPNGVVSIDHLVVFTPDRARTVAALEAVGLRLRRLRDEPTPAGGGGQAFFRLGEVILEVVEQGTAGPRPVDPSAPARFWGLALGVESIERSAELLGDRIGPPREAVQEGRLIATLRRDAGLAVPVALMSPGPGAA